MSAKVGIQIALIDSEEEFWFLYGLARNAKEFWMFDATRK
jgi:hypothetical protein